MVKSTFFKDFIAGGTAAAISDFIGAPFERIKMLLQVQIMSNQIRPEERYKGIWDCLVRIPREQGFFSFWRGGSISMFRTFSLQALNFGFKDQLRVLYGADNKDPHFWRLLAKNMAAGGTAGILALSIAYPLDFVRTRVGADVGPQLKKRPKPAKLLRQTTHPREFNGLVDCVRKTWRADGIRGFYQGFLVSCVGSAIYRSCYFGLYDTAKGMLAKEKKPKIYVKFIYAQCAVATAGIVSFPFDTVRRRMMMQAGKEKGSRPYQNQWATFGKIAREEGVRALFMGSTANVLRSFTGALVLVLYDEFKSRLNH